MTLHIVIFYTNKEGKFDICIYIVLDMDILSIVLYHISKLFSCKPMDTDAIHIFFAGCTKRT